MCKDAARSGLNISFTPSLLDCTVGNLPVTYLGLPLILCHGLKKDSCAALVDKVTAKFNSWNGIKLSLAGRMELVRMQS